MWESRKVRLPWRCRSVGTSFSPSGKPTKSELGKSPFLMGKSTISMAIFNSYVSHYQRVSGKYSSKPCWQRNCNFIGNMMINSYENCWILWTLFPDKSTTEIGWILLKKCSLEVCPRKEASAELMTYCLVVELIWVCLKIGLIFPMK